MFISFIFFGGSLFPCPQASLKRLTLLSRREQRYWSNTSGSPLYLVLTLSEDEQLFHCWDGESDIPHLHFSIYMFGLLWLLFKCGLPSPLPPPLLVCLQNAGLPFFSTISIWRTHLDQGAWSTSYMQTCRPISWCPWYCSSVRKAAILLAGWVIVS